MTIQKGDKVLLKRFQNRNDIGIMFIPSMEEYIDCIMTIKRYDSTSGIVRLEELPFTTWHISGIQPIENIKEGDLVLVSNDGSSWIKEDYTFTNRIENGFHIVDSKTSGFRAFRFIEKNEESLLKTQHDFANNF